MPWLKKTGNMDTKRQSPIQKQTSKKAGKLFSLRNLNNLMFSIFFILSTILLNILLKAVQGLFLRNVTLLEMHTLVNVPISFSRETYIYLFCQKIRVIFLKCNK